MNIVYRPGTNNNVDGLLRQHGVKKWLVRTSSFHKTGGGGGGGGEGGRCQVTSPKSRSLERGRPPRALFEEYFFKENHIALANPSSCGS